MHPAIHYRQCVNTNITLQYNTFGNGRHMVRGPLHSDPYGRIEVQWMVPVQGTWLNIRSVFSLLCRFFGFLNFSKMPVGKLPKINCPWKWTNLWISVWMCVLAALQLTGIPFRVYSELILCLWNKLWLYHDLNLDKVITKSKDLFIKFWVEDWVETFPVFRSYMGLTANTYNFTKFQKACLNSTMCERVCVSGVLIRIKKLQNINNKKNEDQLMKTC